MKARSIMGKNNRSSSGKRTPPNSRATSSNSQHDSRRGKLHGSPSGRGNLRHNHQNHRSKSNPQKREEKPHPRDADHGGSRGPSSSSVHPPKHQPQRYPPPFPPYYYPPYYQNEYMPPPMWPPFYHPAFNYQQGDPGKAPQGDGNDPHPNYRQFFTMPPPLLPYGMFQNRKLQRPPGGLKQTEPSSKIGEEAEKPEPAPLGSEAAREKERADIAKRLKDLDNKKPKEGEQKQNAPSTSQSKPSPQPVKKPNPQKVRVGEKAPKRRSTSESGDGVPSKKSTSASLNSNILSQITAMGREEIKGIVNNPQSAKSQEILKALMDRYRELKGVELDKRRLLAPTASSSLSTPSALLSGVDAIEISDLPPELIAELNNFLGYDLLGQDSQDSQASDDVVILNDSVPEVAVIEQEQQPQMPPQQPRSNDPEKILEELVMIDMRMQSDFHRKMDLYRQLHDIMVKRNGGPEADDSNPQPPSTTNSQQEEIILPVSPPSSLIQHDVPSSSTALNSPPPVPQGKKLVEKTKKTKVSTVKEKKTKSKEPAKRAAPEKIVLLESHFANSSIENIKELSSQRKEFDLRGYKFEIYDMKVATSTVVIVACSDHNLYGFNIESGKTVYEYKSHVDVVTCVMPVSLWRGGIQEQIICSGGLDEHICIFGLKSQQCVSKYYVASAVQCLEYYHDKATDSKLLYAGLKNGTIQIYDVEKFIPKGSLDCGNRAITAILATKEGPLNVLLVAAEDRTICLRDASSGLYLRQYNYSFIATKFVLHGSTFFCQSTSNGITCFDLNTAEYLGFIKTVCSVSRIARLKNILFVTLFSGAIRIYDMNTRQFIAEISIKGKLLRYLDAVDDKIIAAARVKDLLVIPFTYDKSV